MTQYEYSSRGELLRVILPDGRTVEYVNDALGRRVAKKINGITVEKYLWGGMADLLAVYEGNGALRYRFEGAKMATPSGNYYLATDQISTVRAVTDPYGKIVKRLDYDSFGNLLTVTDYTAPYPPLPMIPTTFAGGLYDPDTKLIHFGFRDYDPNTGRWTAKDPIGFAAGDTNLYGYCVANPVCFFDPMGLDYTLGSFLGAGWEFYVSVESSLNALFPTNPLIGAFFNESPISQARRFESTDPGLTTGTKICFYTGSAAGIAAGGLSALGVGSTAAAAEIEGTSYSELVTQAAEKYPKLVARGIENHHIVPQYLGGARNGPTVPLPAPYHQEITNAFRDAYAYMQDYPDPQELMGILQRVYSQWPIFPE